MKRYPWYWTVMTPISGSGMCSPPLLRMLLRCSEVARSHSMHFWKCCSFVTVTWGNYFLSLMIKLLKDCSSSPAGHNVQLQRREGNKYIHCPYDQAEFLCLHLLCSLPSCHIDRSHKKCEKLTELGWSLGGQTLVTRHHQRNIRH